VLRHCAFPENCLEFRALPVVFPELDSKKALGTLVEKRHMWQLPQTKLVTGDGGAGLPLAANHPLG
jgi:hypothetical protein